MYKAVSFFLFLLFFYSQGLFSQQSVFYMKKDTASYTMDKFGLAVYNLNFIKNNEYFNFIADGYSLLGSQLHPEFIYQASQKAQLKVGVFASKNFGEDSIDKLIPTFTFSYRHKKHSISIGNIYAKDNHQLIEPLLASEKILTANVLENGFQYIFNGKTVYFDGWLNWERAIEPYDDEREEFTMGAFADVGIFSNENTTLSIPLQYVYYHRGGQINKKFRFENNSENLILNFNNASAGLVYQTRFLGTSKLRFGYYYLSHTVNSVKEEFTFENGNAHYIQGTFTTGKFECTLSYFIGNRFISARGNEMFQSYSLKANVNYWEGTPDDRFLGHTEPNRSLLFAKATYKFDLSPNIILGLEAQGFYQLHNATLSTLDLRNTKGQFDYSYAVYIRFNELFPIK